MRYLSFIFLLVISMTLSAAGQSASQALAEFAWQKRQLIVFTPSQQNEAFKRFQAFKTEYAEDFAERKLQVWTIEAGKPVLLEGKQNSRVTAKAFYDRFAVKTGEFQVILIGYDQGEKLRQRAFNIDDLLGEIDQMPMRRQEIRSQD